MASHVSKSKRFVLNGIFGLLKEKGDSVDDYRQWLRLIHFYESKFLGDHKEWSSPAMVADISPRYAEPFTTGVLCVGLGFWKVKSTAFTEFWPHEYIVCGKLGIETQNYWSESPVVKEMPYDHVTQELINEKAKNFIGTKEQYNPPYIWKQCLIPRFSLSDAEPEKSKRFIEPVVPRQTPPRLRQCHTIDVLELDPPNFKLKVVSDGFFSCRRLVNDLGHQLNSCAHLTQLHLNRMGVITADKCLKKYELHLQEIKEAIDKYSNYFEIELKAYEGKKKLTRRVR